MITLFKQNVFRRYFFSCSLAYIGINIGLIGISWYIIAITGSNLILANYSAITITTTILSSIFVGVLVDKYNKSILMKICCCVQAIFILLLFEFLHSSQYRMIMIYGMAVTNSLGLALYNTTSRGILGEIIIEKDLLIQGNSILEMSMQIGAIIAAGATGILYDILGIKIIIYIMVSSLIISALILKKLKNGKIANNTKKTIQLSIDKKKILILGLISFIPFIVTLLSNDMIPIKDTYILSTN